MRSAHGPADDRRATARRNLTLPARLAIGNGPPLDCRIDDFCGGGVYLKLEDEAWLLGQARGLGVGADAELLFNWQGRDFTQPLRVMRSEERGVGARFETAPGAGLGALMEAADQPAEESAGSQASSRLSAQQNTLLLKRIDAAIFEYLQDRLKGLGVQIKDAFDEAAETAVSDQARTTLVDTLMQLEPRFPMLRQSVLNHVQQEWRRRSHQSIDAPVPTTGDAVNATGELSLVDKSEFEEWLAGKVVISRAENANSESLLALKLRFDALGLKIGRGYDNPIGPSLFCNAWRQTLQEFKVQAAAERIAMRVFEEAVMLDLGRLYNQVNRLFIAASVLPKLDVSRYFPGEKKKVERRPRKESISRQSTGGVGSPVAPTRSDSNQRVSPGSGPGGPGGQAGSAGQPQQAGSAGPVTNVQQKPPTTKATSQTDSESASDPFSQAMDRARKAQDLKRAAGEIRFDGNAELNTAEASFRMAQQLLMLLRQEREAHPPSVPQSQTFRVMEGGSSYTNREMFGHLYPVQTAPRPISDEKDLDSSGLRERMYGHVTTGGNVAKPITPQQDQALDVVDRFFAEILKNKRLTPTARNQIKSLELPVLKVFLRNPKFFEEQEALPKQVINRIAQLGLKGGRTPTSVVQRINELIGRIQSEYDSDPSVFEEVLGELNSLLERQNLLYRRNVERVAAAAEGQQKINKAKRAVEQALDSRLGGKRVPKAIMTLVNGGWRDLLTLTWIRSGMDSREWQDYLQVVDTLLQVAEHPEADISLGELLRVIQEGLASISSQQMPSGHIRDELKAFLAPQKGQQIEWVDVPYSGATDDQAGVRMVSEARQRGMQRWLARVQRMQVGTWINLQSDKGGMQMLRLAWAGPDCERMVFVNHQGMRVIEMNGMELAGLMQKRRAIIDPTADRDVVDESLDNMVRGLYEQLNHATGHDELTGLLQRKEFMRHLSQHLARRSEEHAGLILLSLDRFRLVNESLGMDGGDRALKEIADFLRKLAADENHVCRYSGDEFLIFAEKDAADLAIEIGDRLRRYRLNWREGQTPVSGSIGYLEIPPTLTDLEEIIRAVEQACHQAKKQGGDRAVCYEADSGQRARREAIARQMADIGEGLSRDKVLLRCQKIIPLHSDTRIGTQYEILLSVYDAVNNLIPISDFVRAAENYRRMQTVDRSVVGLVLEWMRDNGSQMETMGAVNINLSGHSMNDESLLEFIFERLTHYDVAMDKICFDITEAGVISNLDEVSDFIQELQEYGCRFCLGDFGSAASYQILKRLPVDMIKLDGSYVRESTRDKQDQMMIQSSTELAHHLGREVVAPHVEDSATLEMLREIGVDYAQGYFIERPHALNGS